MAKARAEARTVAPKVSDETARQAIRTALGAAPDRVDYVYTRDEGGTVTITGYLTGA